VLLLAQEFSIASKKPLKWFQRSIISFVSIHTTEYGAFIAAENPRMVSGVDNTAEGVRGAGEYGCMVTKQRFTGSDDAL
jgi:hypothetical protein